MAAKPEGWKSSRMQMWLDEGLDLGLPDISGVEYLRDWMAVDGLGWCQATAMGGAEPHSWAEIDAFSRVAGLYLEPWEARQIRSMSAAYVEGMVRGGEALKVSPAFEDRPDEDPGIPVERRRISEQFKAGLKALTDKG